MSLATETLDRIRNQEVFDSRYTKMPISEFDIMDVDDEALFKDLTHRERLQYSDTSGKYPVLNIWKDTFIYVTKLKIWVQVTRVNTYNSNCSWKPTYVKVDDHHLLDVKNKQLYKIVED